MFLVAFALVTSAFSQPPPLPSGNQPVSQENPLYPNNRPIRAEDDMEVDDDPATSSQGVQNPSTPGSGVPSGSGKVVSDPPFGATPSTPNHTLVPEVFSNTPISTVMGVPSPENNDNKPLPLTPGKKAGQDGDDDDGEDEGELPATPGSNQAAKPPGNPDFDHSKPLPYAPGRKSGQDNDEDEEEDPDNVGPAPLPRTPTAKDPDYDKMPVAPKGNGEDSDDEEDEDGGEE